MDKIPDLNLNVYLEHCFTLMLSRFIEHTVETWTRNDIKNEQILNFNKLSK